ncbi:NIPSNAP family protein [Chloroflexota bacterium]
MIYYQATLPIAAGKIYEFNDLLANHLQPGFERYGAKLIGSWETAVGTLNEVTDLWGFENMGHFEESFQSFLRDKELRPIWPKAPTIILGETGKLLRPLPCSPLK